MQRVTPFALAARRRLIFERLSNQRSPPAMTLIVVAIALLAALALARWFAHRIADAASIDAPKSGGWLWISLAIAFVGLFLGLGDFTIPGFVLFWTSLWSWRLWPRWSVSLPLVLTVCVIWAHAVGHRLYGSPRVVDNRPLLQSPYEVERLEAPNLLVCADGSRHGVAGIEFRPEILALPSEDQRRAIDRRGQPLRILADPSQPSGYIAEHRIDYCCGNSFFPSFFPHDLPSHKKEDLAIALRFLAVRDPTE